jgi:hypothetical protein
MYRNSGKHYYFVGKLPHGVSGGAVTLAVICSVSLELSVYGDQNRSRVSRLIWSSVCLLVTIITVCQ